MLFSSSACYDLLAMCLWWVCDVSSCYCCYKMFCSILLLCLCCVLQCFLCVYECVQVLFWRFLYVYYVLRIYDSLRFIYLFGMFQCSAICFVFVWIVLVCERCDAVDYVFIFYFCCFTSCTFVLHCLYLFVRYSLFVLICLRCAVIICDLCAVMRCLRCCFPCVVIVTTCYLMCLALVLLNVCCDVHYCLICVCYVLLFFCDACDVLQYCVRWCAVCCCVFDMCWHRCIIKKTWNIVKVM